MPKIKVLMFSWEYPPRVIGGLATHVKYLTDELRNMDVEVVLLTCDYPGATEYEKFDGLTVRRVESYTAPTPDFASWVLLMNVAMEREAIRLVKEMGVFDIIHAHDWLVAKPAISLKHLYRVPLISTIHSTEHGRRQGLHTDYHRMIHQIEWWLTYESWKVICCSNNMRAEVMQLFGTPHDKIVVIPNGVDSRSFSQASCDQNLRRRYAVDFERIILHVGRSVPEKGANVLVGAMPGVLRSHPEAKLVIAGDGYYKEELMRIASSMGLSEKVHFAGYVRDEILRALYKCATVAVFPSVYEPFGIVALEAMASGCPVIVSDVGGLTEIVDNEVNAIKVPVNNSDALASAISRLLGDQDLRNRLTKEALLRVDTVYNWQLISKGTKDLYLKTIEEAKSNPWVRGSLPHRS